LLFDGGGTLMFLDQDFLAATAAANGVAVPAERFNELHAGLVYELDAGIRAKRRFPKKLEAPESYWQRLFQQLGLPVEAARRAAQATETRHAALPLWTFTFPWVLETLDQLKQAGYGMSMVSNEEGLLAQELVDLNMQGYFDVALDALNGVSKPQPGIYQRALKALDLRAEDCLFIGNVFFMDVWGANRVGMPGLHLDPFGLYQGWEGARLRDVGQLPAWLESYTAYPARADVFPLRDFTLLSD
jgi:putative hydrolase of the HAD superfamily